MCGLDSGHAVLEAVESALERADALFDEFAPALVSGAVELGGPHPRVDLTVCRRRTRLDEARQLGAQTGLTVRALVAGRVGVVVGLERDVCGRRTAHADCRGDHDGSGDSEQQGDERGLTWGHPVPS